MWPGGCVSRGQRQNRTLWFMFFLSCSPALGALASSKHSNLLPPHHAHHSNKHNPLPSASLPLLPLMPAQQCNSPLPLPHHAPQQQAQTSSTHTKQYNKTPWPKLPTPATLSPGYVP